MNERDAELLDRALDLAERGRRSASPNPVVGCVIARDGRVLGEGWHERRGEPHAERNALDACSEPPQGATAYVSLEPCSHHGRQPPCADALIAAGIARVVCAIGDPEPRGRRARPRAPAGGGSRRSSSPAGATRRARAARTPPSARYVVRGRPFVLLKLAATLDGRIATSTGREPLDLLAREPRGSCTTGGPSSTPSPSAAGRRWPTTPSCCRATPSRRPSACRCASSSTAAGGWRPAAGWRGRAAAAPVAARGPGRRAAAARRASRRWRPRLARGGARRCSARARSRRCWSRAAPSSPPALLRAGLVDALALFLAPRLIGGDGRPLLGPLGVSALADAPALLETSVREIGPDVLVEGLLQPLP